MVTVFMNTRTHTQSHTLLWNSRFDSVVEAIPFFDKTLLKTVNIVDPGTV